MVNKNLGNVLEEFGKLFGDIKPNSSIITYRSIDVIARILGYDEISHKYKSELVGIPRNNIVGGTRIVDSSELKGAYVQLDSGIFVTREIAIESGLEFRLYEPPSKQMTLCF